MKPQVECGMTESNSGNTTNKPNQKQSMDRAYGIYSLDGTIIVISVYDPELNTVTDAHRFVSRKVAINALNLVDPELVAMHEGIIIREIIEA